MIFKMKSTEKNEFVASPATTGARLYSLMLALCLPADKNQKKSQKVLCKSAHETETRVARPPEQINVHIIARACCFVLRLFYKPTIDMVMLIKELFSSILNLRDRNFSFSLNRIVSLKLNGQ